jgi:hypothetical protein
MSSSARFTSVTEIKKGRVPFLLLAILCLVAGLLSGLSRIGWNIGSFPGTSSHGALMVGSFLGTLISLEKIIPLKKKWLYLIPGINASSILLFLINQSRAATAILTATSLSLSIVFGFYFLRHRSTVYLMMLVGAVCWLIGNIFLFTDSFYPLAFPWWVAFILLIIVAERIELMKLLPVSGNQKAYLAAFLVAFIVGILFSFHGWGSILCGSSLMLISIWLLRHDVISVNMKKTKLPKFVATALLIGYVALFLTGFFFIALSDQWLTYDAIVHTFFIGFTFSMIFAHGPIILPGVLGISKTPFGRILYVWLFVLHASWIMRTFADVAIDLEIRKFSGLISAAAIVGYFATVAFLMISNRQHAKIL